MNPGQRLTAGEFVRVGAAVLTYQGDGNLVLYVQGRPVWASDTFGAPGHVEMQHDGNLVIYDGAGVPIWASNTVAPGARLVVSPAGLEIVAQMAIWRTPPVTTPEPGPGPEPGTHIDPLRGQLRLAHGFVDDTGPRLPFFWHGGDVIGQGLLLGVAHVEPIFDHLAALGVHGLRSWFQLHIPHGTWIPGPTERGWNPLDDRRRFVEVLAAGAARGLKWNLSGGGIAGLGNSVENELFTLVADAIGEIGPEHFAMVSALNEARDTGDSDDTDPAELARLVGIVRARFPEVLYSLTAFTGHEDRELTRRFTPAWGVSILNGSRAGRAHDKIRHVFSWMREDPVRPWQWQDEPFGVPPGVSAMDNGHELDAHVMTLAGCMSAMARQVWTYMSGDGVVFRSFDRSPGLAETAAALRGLPQDLMQWDVLSHSGPSQRGLRIHAVREDAPEVREDYAIDTRTGRYLAIRYGPPDQRRDLPKERITWDDQMHVEGPWGRVTTGRLS